MTASRDPDRLVQAFVNEGEERLSDGVYDAVRAAIDHKRQRAVLGPWRMPIMNKIAGFGLAAAAIVAVVLVGAQLFGASSSSLGGPGGEATTRPPEASANVEPPTEPSAAAGLREGPFVLTDRSIDGMPLVPMTVTIPAPGWNGEEGSGILTKGNPDTDGAGLITFTGELFVYGDPCAWSTTRPETPVTTPDELVAALAAQASRAASEPIDVTLGGYAGKGITLHVPEDAVFTDCDRDTFGSWGLPGTDGSPFRWHQAPGQIDEVWAVEVDGTLVVIDWAYYAATPQESVGELRAIVESVTFGE
jgi:hypothetical protein